MWRAIGRSLHHASASRCWMLRHDCRTLNNRVVASSSGPYRHFFPMFLIRIVLLVFLSVSFWFGSIFRSSSSSSSSSSSFSSSLGFYRLVAACGHVPPRCDNSIFIFSFSFIYFDLFVCLFVCEFMTTE